MAGIRRRLHSLAAVGVPTFIEDRLNPEWVRRHMISRAWTVADLAREARISIWATYRLLEGRKIYRRYESRIVLAFKGTPAVIDVELEETG